MDPEAIILGEISQTEKDKYWKISLMCEIRKEPNSYRKESDLWLPAADS